MADVVVFFGKIITPNIVIKKIFFSKQIDFLKKTIFEKSEKIHSNKPKYHANFRYIIKVRTQKLCEM